MVMSKLTETDKANCRAQLSRVKGRAEEVANELNRVWYLESLGNEPISDRLYHLCNVVTLASEVLHQHLGDLAELRRAKQKQEQKAVIREFL